MKWWCYVYSRNGRTSSLPEVDDGVASSRQMDEIDVRRRHSVLDNPKRRRRRRRNAQFSIYSKKDLILKQLTKR